MTDCRVLYPFWSDLELLHENRLVKLPQQLLHYFFFPPNIANDQRNGDKYLYPGYEGRRDAWTACKKVSEGSHGDVSCGYFSASGCFEAPAGDLQQRQLVHLLHLRSGFWYFSAHWHIYLCLSELWFWHAKAHTWEIKRRGVKSPIRSSETPAHQWASVQLKANNLIRMNHLSGLCGNHNHFFFPPKLWKQPDPPGRWRSCSARFNYKPCLFSVMTGCLHFFVVLIRDDSSAMSITDANQSLTVLFETFNELELF